jgi:type I restriction enzyme S subunit
MNPSAWEAQSRQRLQPLNKMADEISLSEIADVLGGFAFKSEHFAADGFPIVKIANIEPPHVNLSDCDKIPKDKVCGLDRFALNDRDIVMAMTGATIGKVGRVRTTAPVYLNQRVAKIAAKAGCEFNDFVWAIVSQRGFDEEVLSNAGGSAQANVSTDGIGRIRIPGFSPEEQRAIGGVIGALDDKIELNRRMNRTLEELAAALFRSWFVDFDPVVAKAAGTKPAHLRPELAASFPAHWQDSELGEIPKGWRVLPLSDICESIFSGGTPHTQTPVFWNGDLPWLSSGETRDAFIVATEKTISKAGVENSSTRFARKGATVIAGAGQGHTRGQTSLLLLDSYINQSVVVAIADREVVSDLFVYFDLARRYEEFRQLSDAHSSRGSLTTKLVGGVKAVVPPFELITKFDAVVSPMVAQIEANLRESRTLAALRDTLLPKLLSGELRVKEPDYAVQAPLHKAVVTG